MNILLHFYHCFGAKNTSFNIILRSRITLSCLPEFWSDWNFACLMCKTFNAFSTFFRSTNSDPLSSKKLSISSDWSSSESKAKGNFYFQNFFYCEKVLLSDPYSPIILEWLSAEGTKSQRSGKKVNQPNYN